MRPHGRAVAGIGRPSGMEANRLRQVPGYECPDRDLCVLEEVCTRWSDYFCTVCLSGQPR